MFGGMVAFVPLPTLHVATKIYHRLRLRCTAPAPPPAPLEKSRACDGVWVRHLKILNKFQCLILIWYRITVISIRAYEGGCCYRVHLKAQFDSDARGPDTFKCDP
jgi:hypothetical protein